MGISYLKVIIKYKKETEDLTGRDIQVCKKTFLLGLIYVPNQLTRWIAPTQTSPNTNTLLT
jgi:hypothetical protein